MGISLSFLLAPWEKLMPRESHSRQHAPRCPTFASDSLPEIYGVELSNMPPAEPFAI